MIDAFKRGEDLHRAMAGVNQGKDPMAVTKSERAMGKVTNFGFLYGQSAKGLSLYARKDYGLILSVKEAEHFRENSGPRPESNALAGGPPLIRNFSN